MQKKQLVDTLQHLHTELSQADRVDPATLQELRAVTDDINRLLDEKADPSQDDVDPVTRGLKNLLLKFESEHPQLSARIGEVADALAAMGI
jgi:ElaB/YqjD/DUF883 family membrane-anchored ribosome-binding protein